MYRWRAEYSGVMGFAPASPRQRKKGGGRGGRSLPECLSIWYWLHRGFWTALRLSASHEMAARHLEPLRQSPGDDDIPLVLTGIYRGVGCNPLPLILGRCSKGLESSTACALVFPPPGPAAAHQTTVLQYDFTYSATNERSRDVGKPNRALSSGINSTSRLGLPGERSGVP